MILIIRVEYLHEINAGNVISFINRNNVINELVLS